MKEALNHKIFSETDCLSEQTLFDYIDKKLNAKESHVVERHLLSCELCSDAIEGLELLKDRNRISTIKAEISKRVSTQNKETKTISINYKIVLSIAASILLLIGGVFFFNLLNSKDEIAALKQDESSLPPQPNTAAGEDQNINSETVLEEAPKTNNIQDTKEGTGENKKAYNRNDLAETESLLRKQAPSTNSVASENDMNSGIGGSAKKDLSVNEGTVLANEEVTEQEYDSKKTTIAQDAPAPVLATAPLRAEKVIADETIADKYDTDDAINTKREKESKKEVVSKAKKSNVSEKAPANSASGIAYAPQEDISAMEDAAYSGSTSKPSTIETMAEYIGGQDSLQSFIKSNFNKQLINKNQTLAKQIAEVKLTIDKKGKVINPTITKGLNTELDKEIIRVILLMPKWKPATINGEKVAKEITLPIQLAN